MRDASDYQDIISLRGKLAKVLRELEVSDRERERFRDLASRFKKESEVYANRVAQLEVQVTALTGPRNRRAVGGSREGRCISFWGVKSPLGPDEIFRRLECPETVMIHQSEEMLSRAYAEFEREPLPFTAILGRRHTWPAPGFSSPRPGYWNTERLLQE